MQEAVQFHKLHYADSQYPSGLFETQVGPNPLYVRGNLRSNIPLVGVVGTRRPTPYGKEVTEQITTELAAAGVGIVSGLAMGVDSIAHKAALTAGGYTIAVLGNGIDTIQPGFNADLGQKILESGGAIISEHPPGIQGMKQHYPARNRIIAGLSLGILVTEADSNSGTRHTVNFALQFGRQVMAVPGNITSPMSAGPNEFIYGGGALVVNASQILEIMAFEATTDYELVLPPPANELEAVIMNLLQRGIKTSQELISKSRLDAAEFARTISTLEITGKVRNEGAGLWSLSRKGKQIAPAAAPRKSKSAGSHTEAG
jgi:DNA processing protein